MAITGRYADENCVIARRFVKQIDETIQNKCKACGLLGLLQLKIRNDRHMVAFTLAEVLITLAIIGVVAAYTIPTLVANTQKTMYVTALQKFYSTFNNNMNAYMASQGCVGDIMCTGALGTTSMTAVQKSDQFETIIPYLFPGASKCPVPWDGTFAIPPCKPAHQELTQRGNYDSRGFHLIYQLPDGMVFYTGGGTMREYLYPDCTNGMAECGSIAVDINGIKGPNIAGRDFFVFGLAKSGRLLPITWGYCDSGKADYAQYNGLNCAGQVIKDSWQMKY